MSFKYRKVKREAAGEILGELAKVIIDEEDPPEVQHSEFPTVEDLSGKLKNHSLQHISSAVDLLESNMHISKETPSDESADYQYHMSVPYIVITRKGREAFYEGWYDKENEKDRLETFKLRYDLYFPVAATILSILALILSIVSLIHGWNKN